MIQTDISKTPVNAKQESIDLSTGELNLDTARSELAQSKAGKVYTLADCEKAPLKDIISKEDYAKLLNGNPKLAFVQGPGAQKDVIHLVKQDKSGNFDFNSYSYADFYILGDKLVQGMSSKLEISSFGTNNKFISINVHNEVSNEKETTVWNKQFCFDQKTGNEFHFLANGKQGELFLDKLKISSRVRSDGVEEPIIKLGIDKNTGKEVVLSFFKNTEQGPQYQITRWDFNSTIKDSKGIQFFLDTLTDEGSLKIASALPYLKMNSDGTIEFINRK
jgi:hypothetical protein